VRENGSVSGWWTGPTLASSSTLLALAIVSIHDGALFTELTG